MPRSSRLLLPSSKFLGRRVPPASFTSCRWEMSSQPGSKEISRHIYRLFKFLVYKTLWLLTCFDLWGWDRTLLDNFHFLFTNQIREGLKKKRKKMWNFPHLGILPPAPSKCGNLFFFFTIFLDVLAHFKHIREKNIFPLEKLKTVRFFTQIWSL